MPAPPRASSRRPKDAADGGVMIVSPVLMGKPEETEQDGEDFIDAYYTVVADTR